ncbi:hypothetical protein LCGC14_0418620 [marine sediment metagenome]|uniref:Uncharacterized protein n=1 Tax=marine sediment metagenome TaxID=412755 RepID=A0A0F9SXI5_9ZZZZ|nr:B12-binding domain-containing radical SAM protein [Phycisphaerae bacterium]HDZ42566.1 B12-binding domain-containing radical SAM protein [Phycisphaerae bacterium]
MRVLFIVRGIEGAEPLGLMYISAMLKQAGHNVMFLPTRGIDLLAEIRRFEPHVIGYSVCTGQHVYYLALNRRLKHAHRFVSVLGGPHATFFPEMVGEDGVDVICRGEGEQAMLELCDRLEAGRDITDIRNLWVKRDGVICRNELRPLKDDLDSLPFPDRESRYALDERHRAYPAQSFITGRGCPYRCAYCFNPSMQALYGPAWGRRRVRSVENVVQEIESVRAVSGLSFVQFRCSMFPFELDWLAEFADVYRRRVGLPFYCHVRADCMSPEVVALMAAAGCRSVNMGIECADETYRRDALRRPMSNATIRAACKRLHAHGIAILADNILGLPGQTLEDDIETLKFNVECEIDYPLAMLLQPYPGTEIDRYARAGGYFNGDYSTIGHNYYFRSPLTFRSEDEKRQVENLHKLFAVAREVPWLLPVVRRLIRLPPNLVFNAIFRCWYAFCYFRRIMTHRLHLVDVTETLKVLFGFYPKESLHAHNQEDRAPGLRDLRCRVRRRGRPVPVSLSHGRAGQFSEIDSG